MVKIMEKVRNACKYFHIKISYFLMGFTLSNNSMKCCYILCNEFGHSLQKITNSKGEPVPWYTYPAIEFLKQIDFSSKTVFEYGCGNSTLYWGNEALRVTSVEDNKEWFNKISTLKTKNLIIKHIIDKEHYINEIYNYDPFDVIIIDGSYRYECAIASINRLSPKGIIILDNSDWCENAPKILREANLIQIDMNGFGPYNPYTWTTSIFLSRDCQLKSKFNIQPIHGTGSWKELLPES
jgi:hypothetical protein